MPDFKFLQNPISKKWVILAPKRAKRPDVAKGAEPVCPFCAVYEKEEVYRVPTNSVGSSWQVRVVPNKFPFAPVHEVIIHSPDHHRNFGELSLSEVELVLQTYRQRYNTHQSKGQVYIFHNRGESGGESLPHPHTQVAVIPLEVKTDIPRLDSSVSVGYSPSPSGGVEKREMVETNHFYLFCPQTSQWPDEVWIAPKKRGMAYGQITDNEIKDLAFVLSRTIQIFDLRHGQEFPFNFYIYPGGDWYLRLIPRVKTLGGFEIGTGIFINTQNPNQTINFIKEHFKEPNKKKIKADHKADYRRGV